MSCECFSYQGQTQVQRLAVPLSAAKAAFVESFRENLEEFGFAALHQLKSSGLRAGHLLVQRGEAAIENVRNPYGQGYCAAFVSTEVYGANGATGAFKNLAPAATPTLPRVPEQMEQTELFAKFSPPIYVKKVSCSVAQ